MCKRFNAVICGRDTGKTSFLLQTVAQAIADGLTVMVIDSASEHREKSLLYKLQISCENTLLPSPQEEQIIEHCSLTDIFGVYPFTEIQRRAGNTKLFLVDAAYYLEQGYETEDLNIREMRRRLYRLYAAQSAWSFAALIQNTGKSLLVMDEIELTESWRMLLPILHNIGCTVWDALHDISGLDPCRDAFSLYTMRDYQMCPLSP